MCSPRSSKFIPDAIVNLQPLTCVGSRSSVRCESWDDSLCWSAVRSPRQILTVKGKQKSSTPVETCPRWFSWSSDAGNKNRSSLPAEACRGSWMPGSNEVPGCLPQINTFLKSFTLISTFSVISDDLLWEAPHILDSQSYNLSFFLLSIFKHLPTLLKKKSGSLDAPRLDARGRRNPAPTVCTPLSSRFFDLGALFLVLFLSFITCKQFSLQKSNGLCVRWN